MFNSKSIIHLGGRAIIVAALTLPTAAMAQVKTETGNLKVQITITEECTLGIGDIDFGSQGVLDENVDADGSITVTCTNGTDYTLSLDTGSGTDASEVTRFMTGAGGTIAYSLYKDVGRSTLWGTGENAFSGIGTGAAVPIPVYGRVPLQNTPAAGEYSDTVTVTLAY